MTRREAAEYLRVSVDTIDRRLIDSPELTPGRIRFARIAWGNSPIRILTQDVLAALPLPPAA